MGTERRALALSTTGGALLVGPDNGLLVPAAESLGGIESAVSLTNADYHLRPVSNTFHGRDVFSPATAHLATGLAPSKLGEIVDTASLAAWNCRYIKEGRHLRGAIIAMERTAKHGLDDRKRPGSGSARG